MDTDLSTVGWSPPSRQDTPLPNGQATWDEAGPGSGSTKGDEKEMGWDKGTEDVKAVPEGAFPALAFPGKSLLDSCLVMRDTSGISTSLGRAIRKLLMVRRETEFTFLVATVILVLLSIFNKSQASSSFEALNSSSLSSCQRDVMPPVQMSRGPRAFSRVSTGKSYIVRPTHG